MNPQLQIDFTSASPINTERMKGQCKRLYDWLMAGNKINCTSPARTQLEIGYLNSRISDLLNKNNVPVQSKFIEVENSRGEKITVKEYWIEKTKTENHEKTQTIS